MLEKLNTARFETFCRGVPRATIAEALGVTQQAVSQRLANIDNIRVREFLAICSSLKEDHNLFIDKEN